MVLRKDFSVVADSEMASSPTSESSPQLIRRAARTYGRRRDDPDTSFTYSEPDSSDSIYRTGPPGIQDEVPASEPSGLPDTDSEGEDEEDEDMLPSLKSRPRFTFGWREKMKEADDDPSILEGVSRVHDERASPKETFLSQGVMETNVVDGNRTPPEARLQDVFDSTPSSVSASHNDSHLDPPSSPFTLKPPRIRFRNQTNTTLHDSDTDNDNKLDSASSSPRTPLLHPIATPKSHLTSSPPTSHHEVSTNSRESSASKRKGKNHERQLSVASEPDSPHGRETSDDFPGTTQSQSTLKPRKKKIKPPTKKDQQEMIRERTRIAVEQQVLLERTAMSERSLKTFFSKLGQREGLQIASEPQPGVDHFQHLAGHGDESLQMSDVSKVDDSGSHERSTRVDIQDPVDHKESSVAAADQRQKLSQLKKFWLSRRKHMEEDGDHELEVEKPTELERQRKSAGKKMSQGQQILLANAGVRKKPLRLDSQKAGQEDMTGIRKAILKQGTSDPHVLNLLLRRQAEEESLDIVKQKEEEWKRLGGTVKDRQPTESVEDAQRNQIQRGLAVWSGQPSTSKSADEDMDDVEESGSDWSKESGSEAGSEDAIDYEKMEMAEDDEEIAAEQGHTDNESDANRSESEKEDEPTFKGQSKGRSRRRVVDSDDSDSGDEVIDNNRLPRPSAARYIASSSDDRTEDENDKENNTRLMFDRSDDKENKAVVRHVPFPSISSHSIFDDTDRDLSLSPPHVVAGVLDQDIKSGPGSLMNAGEEREPFSVLSEASHMSPRNQSTGLTQSFDIQLERSPSGVSFEDGGGFALEPSAPAASFTFAPVFDGESSGKGKEPALGFSQVSQESGTRSFGAPSLLRRSGLSDLFSSNTQKEDVPGELRKQESLGLTQDLILQPALQVDEKLLRKADMIFEKEQESVVEAMNKKDIKEQEVYVNDLGFLTQTRPSASRLSTRSPSFVLSPTQPRSRHSPAGISRTQTQSDIEQYPSDSPQTLFRPPLRTISLSNPQLSSPESSPKRLRKRSKTPTIRESPTRNVIHNKASPSPLRRPNAFGVLSKGPSKARERGKDRDGVVGKMVRKEWLAEEAEESDEDEAVGFGFIKRKSGEEDEEGDNADLDATLPELVDDQQMDEDTEGADKVMEKHQELLEQDDEAALKFHQGVVEGELRKKRKNRFGVEDSDDEDEEDDRARRIRRKMREKVERGDIQELAANEKTAAFASIYQSGLVDDEPIEVRPLDFNLDFHKGEEPDDGVSENEESEEQGTSNTAEAESAKHQYVTYEDIRAEVQKMKEQPESDIRNYTDVSWIDQREEEMDLDPVDVHIVPSNVKKSTVMASIAKPIAEWDSFMKKGGIRRKENEKDLERSRVWAKNETRNMTGSTGRLVGGIAVTGLGTKAKDGGGSLRPKASISSISASDGGKKSLRAESSILAGIARRKEQFQ